MRILASLIAAFCAASSADAAEKIGIVAMHGKEASGNAMAQTGGRLAAAGYLVETPEMCWSKRRIYDLSYRDCMKDIDTAAERLKRRGATEIVVYGHSVGGNMALGYGANREGLKGIIVTAAGHHPGGIMGSFPAIAKAYEQAKQMIAEGQGNKRTRFPDNNDTGLFYVNATPESFVSWYEPAGDANMHLNVRKLTAPLLWVSGDADRLQHLVKPIFDAAPEHPLNRHVTIKATHRGTPTAAHATVVKWLKELAANK
jgi:esterase/lipase